MIWLTIYNDKDAFFAEIARGVAKSLIKACSEDETKQLVVEGIDKGLGTPSHNDYIRRGANEGLTDPKLIAINVPKGISSKTIAKKKSFEFELMIQSTAGPNKDPKYRGTYISPGQKRADGQPLVSRDFYVGAIVETGIGYSWRGSHYYTKPGESVPEDKKRPIYKHAGEKLVEGDYLSNKVSSCLKKFQWK